MTCKRALNSDGLSPNLQKAAWRKAVICVLTSLFVLIPASAIAEDFSPLKGSELQQMCESSDRELQAVCVTYLRGFDEGLTLGQQLSTANVSVCPVRGLTGPERKASIEAVLHAHSEDLKRAANVAAARSILERFRCKPGEGPSYGK